VLRRRIDSCKGVVQLLGKCYGAEPPTIDGMFGRVSYTQYEGLYSLSKGKKVWYLFLDESFPADSHEAEDEEKQKLQCDYREKVKADSHLYHSLNSREGLEASVLKLRDDLTRLRRGVKRWAALVAVLLVLIVALSIWLLQGQHALQEKFDKLQQGVNSFAEIQNKLRQEQPGQKAAEIEQGTYEVLAKQLGIDAATLKEQLPRFAEQLKKSPNATTYERANAAYVAKDYNEAERLALAAAEEAQSSGPAKNGEAITAFELAGWAAQKRIEYADALKRFRDAEALTDRTRDPLEWARVQYAIAWILYYQGKFSVAEGILREVLKERETGLGPEHPDTLATRHNLGNALDDQGKYPEAEAECRVVLALEEKVHGPEHPTTMGTRNNLALVLAHLGKYAEAEMEYRAVIKLEEKVRNPEDPDTLGTRSNLANALSNQGKYAEAEAENRAVLKVEDRVLGPEHPLTLLTRGNLVEVLADQGKYAEAETECRAVLKLKEKVLGPEHPDTLYTRNDLANALDEQGKYAEAEAEYRAVLKLREKVIGTEHPNTLSTCFYLARCLHAEGSEDEARELAQRAADGAHKVLGPEHPDTKKYEQLCRELQAKESRVQ
jgi:tetratricopeptide (TPR) repeat protein